MKKYLLLPIAIFSLFTSSCSSDDDNDDSSNSIVGVWKLSQQFLQSGSDGTVLQSYPISACDAQSTNEFKSNGTFVETYYTASGTNCVLDGTDGGTYNYNTNTKILNILYADSSSETVHVTKLTNNVMEVFSYDGDNNGDGVEDKFVTYLYR